MDQAPARASTPTALARALLAATRDDERPDPLLDALAGLDERALTRVRTDRPTALAFWLNCYNAATAVLVDRRPGLYESRLRSLRFFRAPAVTVAGHPLGLDAIEHGILRASRSKYALGYLPRLLPDRFETRYRLAEPEPRVHFALHCGAVSCPAVRVYDPATVDAQLDAATRAYLDGTVEYDPEAGVVRVPRPFRWFPGDFGGTDGVLAFLRRYDQLPPDAAPTLSYREWDWTRQAPTFAD